MTDLTTLPDAELCERAAIMLGWEHPNPHLSAWEDASGRYRGGGLTPTHLLADVLAWLWARRLCDKAGDRIFGPEIVMDGDELDVYDAKTSEWHSASCDGTREGIARAVLVCALRAAREEGK